MQVENLKPIPMSGYVDRESISQLHIKVYPYDTHNNQTHKSTR
jgi:hypothetical protein